MRAGLLIEERAWIPLVERIFGAHIPSYTNQAESLKNGINWKLIFDTSAPNAAIAVEQFKSFGAQIVIRCGTCGSISPHLKRGMLLLASGGVRDEGVSRRYAPNGFPAVPSIHLMETARELVQLGDAAIESGIVWTTDGRFIETDDELSTLARCGAVAIDMETSAFYIVSQVRGIHALSLGLVTDEPWLDLGKDVKGRIEYDPSELVSNIRNMLLFAEKCATNFLLTDSNLTRA